MRTSIQTSVGLLALIMLVKVMMMPVVYINFKLNQDYITKVLCINRDKPQLKCNGSCILMQKMKKAQNTEQSQEKSTSKQQTPETFCDSLFDFKALQHFSEREEFVAINELFLSHYLSEIFHPPQSL